MNYRKKLIEVALPLEKINVASAREKSIRHGHPSTLHLWWARRPLAACRAVLFASLVDDPDSDPQFRRADGSVDVERAAARRAELFNLIEQLVQWENSNNPTVINAARAQIAATIASRKIFDTKEWTKDQIVCREKAWDYVCRHAKPENVNDFLIAHAPPVLDPFCGGGSIPLEAQRLGLRAFGSDLNPVPVLITKALIEIPPKFANLPPVNPESNARLAGTWKGAQGLAEDVRYYGQWMRDQAEKRIGHLYPKVKVTAEMAKDRPDLKAYIGQELTVIAWIWARTVACPNPSCRARTPLVRSFWLSTKKGKAFYAEPILDREGMKVRFRIRSDGQPPQHTTDRTGATCLFCGTFMKKPQLREICVTQGIREIPLAIVLEGTQGRVYFPGDAVPMADIPKPSTPFLDQPMTNDRRWFSPPLYGMPNFSDLFTPRQLTALTTFSDLVKEAREKVLADALVVQASCLPSTTSILQTSRPPTSTQKLSSQPSHFVDPRKTPFVRPKFRGELPHLEKPGGTYFVTFRLADAVKMGKQKDKDLPEKAGRMPAPQGLADSPELAPEEVARECETPLTLGSCALGRDDVAAMVQDALLHFHNQHYQLHAWCIMPNHVHVVVTPLDGHELSAILHSWKSYYYSAILSRLAAA
jgi:putative DNA methylase